MTKLLSDEQRLKIIYTLKEDCVTDFLTRDVGPYEVTKLTFTAERLFDAIEAAVLEAQGKHDPVAWMGRNGEDFSYKQSEYFSVPLYAAPVVQPGMVIVPREATPEMVSAGYSKITMEIENSSRDISDVYMAMIAAAEGKESK